MRSEAGDERGCYVSRVRRVWGGGVGGGSRVLAGRRFGSARDRAVRAGVAVFGAGEYFPITIFRRLIAHTRLTLSLLSYQWPVLAIGLGAGFVGSLIDSCLGATIQFSGYCCEKRRMVSKPGPSVTKVSGINVLSNSAVNFVSAAICAAALYFGAIAMGLPRA
jgi:hypothetical protein